MGFAQTYPQFVQVRCADGRLPNQAQTLQRKGANGTRFYTETPNAVMLHTAERAVGWGSVHNLLTSSG